MEIIMKTIYRELQKIFILAYSKLLKRSPIWRTWYKHHLNTLLYEIESVDFFDNKEKMLDKYLKEKEWLEKEEK